MSLINYTEVYAVTIETTFLYFFKKKFFIFSKFKKKKFFKFFKFLLFFLLFVFCYVIKCYDIERFFLVWSSGCSLTTEMFKLA